MFVLCSVRACGIHQRMCFLLEGLPHVEHSNFDLQLTSLRSHEIKSAINSSRPRLRPSCSWWLRPIRGQRHRHQRQVSSQAHGCTSACWCTGRFTRSCRVFSHVKLLKVKHLLAYTPHFAEAAIHTINSLFSHGSWELNNATAHLFKPRAYIFLQALLRKRFSEVKVSRFSVV